MESEHGDGQYADKRRALAVNLMKCVLVDPSVCVLSLLRLIGLVFNRRRWSYKAPYRRLSNDTHIR